MAVKFPTVTCSEKLALILGARNFIPEVRRSCIPIKVMTEDGKEKMLWWHVIYEGVHSITSKGKKLTS